MDTKSATHVSTFDMNLPIRKALTVKATDKSTSNIFNAIDQETLVRGLKTYIEDGAATAATGDRQ